MRSPFIPVGILLTCSLLVVSSVSRHLFYLELLWIALACVMLIILSRLSLRVIRNARWLMYSLYGISVAMLVFVLAKGPIIRNARSWIVLGPINFQPIELVKIALILLYATYLSRRYIGIEQWKTIIASAIFFIIPAALVALQPNLGSALVLFGIWYGTLLVSGLPWRQTVALFGIFLIGGALIWSFALHDYQRNRIKGFLYPNQDVLGINYHATQSKIAIGSGGFFGKGYHQGTQVQLGYLAVPESDFAFATLTEEWGLLGALVVLFSYGWLTFRILKIAQSANNNFEKYICLGTLITLSLQFLINTGSETGLLPVIGLPIPFLSYSGSALMANMFLIGLVNLASKNEITAS
jgi:rod shape determining protein RodA